MKKLLFYISVFLFVSCSSPQIPKWYINTPKDTPLYFYSSAEGYTKENAVKLALNDIASRINVKISSSFVINRGIHNKKTYNEIYQQIKTRISDIDFNNYEILKTVKTDGKYYVLIRINKQKLIQNLVTKLNIKFQNLNFNGDSPIKKVISSYKVLNRLKKIKSDVFILESLGSDITDYMFKIKNIEKKALTIINKTPFKIKANEFKPQSIEILSEYLNIQPDSSNLIYIKIKLQKLKLFNDFLIKGKADIILDKPYSFYFLGKSVAGYKEATVFAGEEYKKRLKKLLKKIFN